MYTDLTIRKSDSIFNVGESASLTCSSDLPVTLTQWLYNFKVVSSSASKELQLTFNPVNDTIHGREYICRTTTPYGIQEESVRVVSQSKLLVSTTLGVECCDCVVPLTEVTVSTTTEGIPAIGQQYSISCIVLHPEGITNPIAVQWYDSVGPLSDSDGITVGDPVVSPRNITSYLEFSPFRSAHGSQFSCTATIMSQTPPHNFSKTADIDIVPGGT